MKRSLKILFLADTHIGFDLPSKPRIERRRRGEDFQRNYQLALEPALRGEVDLVVHGGDVLYRSKVPPSLVIDAFTPLFQVADAGVPVFVVPGNHERSAIPYPLLAMHQGVHIFDRPRTISIQVGDHKVALSGFEYQRDSIRKNFKKIVEETGFKDAESDIHLLVMHQAVDGATVGPVDYMFRNAPDVVCSRDIPDSFSAVLSGHIHRAQIMDKDLNGNPLKAPIIYPGSIERTSFAEKNEAKGFFILEFLLEESTNTRSLKTSFVELPSRPMVELSLELPGKTIPQIEAEISSKLASLADDSIVKFRVVHDEKGVESFPLTAERLRTLAPATMNVEMSYR